MKWPKDTLKMLLSEYRAIKHLSDMTNYICILHLKMKDAWGHIGHMFGCYASEVKQKLSNCWYHLAVNGKNR
jgi:hypothetical protein